MNQRWATQILLPEFFLLLLKPIFSEHIRFWQIKDSSNLKEEQNKGLKKLIILRGLKKTQYQKVTSWIRYLPYQQWKHNCVEQNNLILKKNN